MNAGAEVMSDKRRTNLQDERHRLMHEYGANAYRDGLIRDRIAEIDRLLAEQTQSTPSYTIKRLSDGRLLVTPAIGRPVIFMPTPPIAAYFCQERPCQERP